MAVVVTTDLVVIDNADSLGGCPPDWCGSCGACLCTGAATIEGAGHFVSRACPPGPSFNNVPAGACNTSLKDFHWYSWIRESDPQQTFACQGLQMGISGAAIGTGDPGCSGRWDVSGADRGVVSYKGWKRVAHDPLRPFDTVTGTPPVITCINHYYWLFGTLSGGRCASYIDQHVKATRITVTAGTCAVPGTFDAVAANDETNVRGLFMKVNGVFFGDTKIIYGDTGTAANFFRETNQTVVFSEWLMSGALYKWSFVGNATSSCNKVRFGTFTGCGNAREGGAGLSISAAGTTPFRFEVIDSNVNEFGLYGSVLVNPPAIYLDRLETYTVEDNSLTTFTEDTRDANDAGASDAAVFPTADAVNDSANFGYNERFSLLNITTGTIGVGTYTVTWEYSTASGFSALTDVTDGTSNFKTSGAQVVSYAIPDDWVTRSVGGDTRYWIRARRDAGTSTTNPLLTQVTVSVGGGARFEHTNAEVIRTTFTNMDTIRIRGSAKFKKNVVSNSVTPAKSAAIDLGSADPAVDTFRDNTISCNTNGILVKGTSTGTTTYNLRNITFSGNTTDVRVDFPGAATICINVLCGGSTPTTASVNMCTTVNVNNNVAVAVNVLCISGNGVACARVGIFTTPVCLGAAALFCGSTDMCGTFAVTHNFM